MSEPLQKTVNIITLVIAVAGVLASAGAFYNQMTLRAALADFRTEITREFERIEAAREFRTQTEKRMTGVEQCCYELQRSFERTNRRQK